MIDPITTTKLIVMASVLLACAVSFTIGRMSIGIFSQPETKPAKRKTGKRKRTSRSRSA